MRKTLLPFAPTPQPLQFEADFQLSNGKLTIVYLLTGSVDQIQLLGNPPVPSARADELWKSTCFEWFVKSSSSKKYWEFNAAPTGFWNFYELEDYRTHLKSSPLVEAPQFSLSPELSSSDHYQFKVEVNMSDLFSNDLTLSQSGRIAITSVIQWKSGEVSYFSLQHPLTKPDFHSDDGFTISLAQEPK